jgi:UPF0716 family protein affecting phage T7 exclusion
MERRKQMINIVIGIIASVIIFLIGFATGVHGCLLYLEKQMEDKLK